MDSKEILDFLGVEASNLDEFKTAFSGKYYSEKQIHDDPKLLGKFTGKTLKKVKQNILNKAREKEIPFTHNEFDEAPLEDVVDTLNARISEGFGTKITELQSQIGKSGEEAIKPFQEKLSKYEQALADEKKAKAEIAGQFEQYKSEAATQIKTTKAQYFKEDVMSKIERDFDPLALKDELKLEGWRSHIEKNFRFDFDEQDNPVILDKTGSKIKNPKKADEWLTPKDVLTMEADKKGLIPKNPQGGKPVHQQVPAPPFGSPPPGQTAPPARPSTNKLAPGMEQYLTK